MLAEIIIRLSRLQETSVYFSLILLSLSFCFSKTTSRFSESRSRGQRSRGPNRSVSRRLTTTHQTRISTKIEKWTEESISQIRKIEFDLYSFVVETNERSLLSKWLKSKIKCKYSCCN